MPPIDDTTPNTDAPVDTGDSQAGDTLLTGDTPAPDSGDDANAEKPDDTDTKAEGNGEADDKDQGAPDAYADFTMPEGIEIDAAAVEAFAPIAKELNLTQDQAQKLVDFQASQIQAGMQGQVDAFAQQNQQWQDAAKADQEIGGDKLGETVANAQSALEKFGNPELTKALEETGMGNHPEVIRLLSKVGALTREDQPGADGGNTNPERSRIQMMYPNQ